MSDSEVVVCHYISNGSLLNKEGRVWFKPPLNVDEAIHYTHQLAQALQYIHQQGYLHGALTFSNVMVVRGQNIDHEPDYAPFLLADAAWQTMYAALANHSTNFSRLLRHPNN